MSAAVVQLRERLGRKKKAAAQPIVLAWLRAVRDNPRLSLGAIALAALLVTYANADGSNCRPGDKRLLAQLKVKERALLKYRRELRDAGLLELALGHAPGRAAEWRLTLPVRQAHGDAPV